MERGEIKVTTNGCFDILHIGHLDFLQRCAAMGDKLVVGINSDDSVRKLKAPPRPINPDLYRTALVHALKYVDEVRIFDEIDPCRFIRRERPDIHVKGAEYKDREIPEQAVCEELGVKLVFLEHHYDVSTTSILKRASGEIPV